MQLKPEIGIVVIVFLGLITGSYFVGRHDMDKDWQLKIATAPVKRDTVTKYDTLPIVHDTVKAITHKPTILPKLEPITCDSNCVDILRTRIELLEMPVSSTCVDDSVGSVDVWYFAKEGTFTCDWKPNPRPIKTITETKTVTITLHDPWYEVPAVIIITGAVVYGATQIFK